MREKNIQAMDNEGHGPEKVIFVRVTAAKHEKIKALAKSRKVSINKMINDTLDAMIGDFEELEQMVATTQNPNQCTKCGSTTTEGCIEDRYCPLQAIRSKVS